MIEQRELITISRQIGSMMEAGVDILRITRVLRAQTENPDILRAFDKLDHDLRMGYGMADAMENVPSMFSPFAVSLVRQGEARNDLAGAFYKIADFLQKEGEMNAAPPAGEPPATKNPYAVVTPSAILPVWVIDDLINRLQVAVLRIFTVVAGLLLTLAAVWASVEAGLVERRWQNVVLCSVAALFIGSAGMWLRRRIEQDSETEQTRRRELEEKAANAFEAEGASATADHNNSTPTTADGTANALEKRTQGQEATFE